MRRQQAGSALVIALVIVAITTIMATALMWRTHLDMRRVEVQLQGQQAMQYLLGAESWTRALLLDDNAEVDHFQEPWAQQAMVLPVEGDTGYIEGRLQDLQGRFNINNLVNNSAEDGNVVHTAWLADYKRLLDILGLDPALANATVDWLDRDLEPTGFEGAEDDFYMSQPLPYRAANGEITSISELRMIKGMTPEQFDRLEPYITALPTRGQPIPININTAPAEVLAAMGDRITAADAAEIVQTREQNPFTGETDIDGRLPNNVFSDSRNHVAIRTEHFLLRSTSGVGSVEITMYSVLRRSGGQVETLRRSRGTL